MNPELSIIILCHNDSSYLSGCVRSISRCTKDTDIELVLVDNASSDDAAAVMRDIRRKSGFPVRIIHNKKNRFFAGGNNQGLEASSGNYVAFLNADTIVTPGWASGLISPFRRCPNLGITGPLTNSAVGLQLVKARQACPAAMRPRPWKNRDFPALRFVPWIIGFCMVMPRPLAVALGGFDELYGPGGYEDYDLCLRARLRGHEIAIAENVYVSHFGGMGYSGMPYDRMRQTNQSVYWEKWCSLLRKKLHEDSETVCR